MKTVNPEPNLEKSEEIRQLLTPGHPVLVIGKAGSGKYFTTQEAFRSFGPPALHYPCSVMDEIYMGRLEHSSPDKPVIISDIQLLKAELLDRMVTWLANVCWIGKFKRVVVLTTDDVTKVPPAIMMFTQVNQVEIPIYECLLVPA